jgi:hypothetical protein
MSFDEPTVTETASLYTPTASSGWTTIREGETNQNNMEEEEEAEDEKPMIVGEGMLIRINEIAFSSHALMFYSLSSIKRPSTST